MLKITKIEHELKRKDGWLELRNQKSKVRSQLP